MPVNVQIEVKGAEELRKFVAGIPDAQYKGARAAFSDAAFGAQKEVLGNLSGEPMQSRSGALAKSITPQVVGTDLSSLSGRIYSGMAYARIHEKGGTVIAKNAYKGMPGGPYLNIPAEDNKTAAGVQRMTAKMVFEKGGKIAARSRMEWGQTQGLGIYLDDKLMFTLAKKVTIKAQLGMEKAADNQIPTLMSALQSMPLE